MKTDNVCSLFSEQNECNCHDLLIIKETIMLKIKIKYKKIYKISTGILKSTIVFYLLNINYPHGVIFHFKSTFTYCILIKSTGSVIR